MLSQPPVPIAPAHHYITHDDLHARLSVLEAQMETIAKNVDSLVALKHKGAGILWVASLLASSVLTSIIYYLTNTMGSIFNGHSG